MQATNVTKLKRDEMIAFLEELKKTHSDDRSIRAFNEIENTLTEKKFGLVFEEHTEEVDEKLKNEIPILCADEERKICKDKNLPYNFIIEGDNLQALYLLEKTHRGKIDCISRSWSFKIVWIPFMEGSSGSFDRVLSTATKVQFDKRSQKFAFKWDSWA